MRKIRLDVNALEVTSFASEPMPEEPCGTVRGHATGPYYSIPCATCAAASCVETCTNPYRTQC